MAKLTIAFDPDSDLDKLEAIKAQLEASKDASREVVMFARMLDKVAERITDESTDGLLRTVDVSSVANTLRTWASDLAPIATQTWSQDEVTKILAMFALFEDKLTDEQKSRLAEVKSVVSQRKTRAPRGEGNTRTYDDRPSRVRIETLSGEKISEQAGNTPMSLTGLTNGVVRYLERHDVEVTDELRSDVKATIKQVVVDGEEEVKLGDFAIVKVAS